MKGTEISEVFMVWCFSDQPKVVRNRFVEVIFGGVCLSFLLNKAIRKHAKNYEFDIDFINKILDCFYVDDFTGGDSDFSKAFGLFKELKQIFKRTFSFTQMEN